MNVGVTTDRSMPMVKFSVCIDTLFTEFPFAERSRKVAEMGFPAIEFWLHDEAGKDMQSLRQVTKECGIEVSDFTMNTPEGHIGGSLVNPRDKSKYLKRVKNTIQVAQMLDCRRMITCSGNIMKGMTMRQQTRNMVTVLSQASKLAKEGGVTLLLEPLNTVVDHVGNFLDSVKLGFQVVNEVNSPNLKLLYDIYHMQIMSGNIIQTLRENIGSIGHIHCAGVPGRHELYMGELNYRNIFKTIDELKYDGYVGLEYFPTLKSEESLKRVRELAET